MTITMTINGIFSFSRALFLAAIVATQGAAGTADDSSTPVLEVTGDQVSDQSFSLSVQDLRNIAVQNIVTSTIWTQGVHEFSGVPLYSLLQHLEVTGTTIQAIALNDYAVAIPISDARPGGPIVAFAIDGQPIPRREKGPLWIIYPFDQSPEYRTETIYSRSIWQLNRLNIVE
ncbi:molybdopterin-dependent oxidoreductase [Parasedimentitalea psychrophila]|uniref:Molybdopterin-dependent oxidoreductase n=1 Tax=Parasedimentitalea psychrophila TaxID=2997337 RepID=A0A9Y2P3F9_9RHOB|nr:molybdopterin-dependent oxidoreductase [Parasedimentitalea psychrophila]WIY25997.1 molybdopterin-dependent oxidoreductase [Parasedimentitalea psychrophila]